MERRKEEEDDEKRSNISQSEPNYVLEGCGGDMESIFGRLEMMGGDFESHLIQLVQMGLLSGGEEEDSD